MCHLTHPRAGSCSHGPGTPIPAALQVGEAEPLSHPKQGAQWDGGEPPSAGPPPPTMDTGRGAGAQAQQGSHRWGCWRGRERKQENQRQGDGGGLSGQHGRGQTQGLSWEVAGGAGVPVLGREARLLRDPHQRRTRDPRALGPRKQTRHAACMMRAKRPLHRPVARRPRCRRLLPSRARLCQVHECPSRLLHFCCCHWPSPESPSPGMPCSSLHKRRATFREGRDE